MLLDGKKVSSEKTEALKTKVSAFPFKPVLGIIRVGDREDSRVYIERKVEYGKNIGVDTQVVHLSEDVSEEDLIKEIKNLNNDVNIHGIIVQLPLPENINTNAVISSIDPKKDVDGLTPKNIHKLVNNEKGIVPATPRGIISLLKYYNIEIEGKKVVVVGRSLLVGKSSALLMLNHDATVTVCHSKTKDLQEKTKDADILIVAVGKANFINKDYVKEGQVVIDVGISPLDESISGDVNFNEVKDIVGAISPVPGGVGPMTVVSLFENLLDVIEKNYE